MGRVSLTPRPSLIRVDPPVFQYSESSEEALRWLPWLPRYVPFRPGFSATLSQNPINGLDFPRSRLI